MGISICFCLLALMLGFFWLVGFVPFCLFVCLLVFGLGGFVVWVFLLSLFVYLEKSRIQHEKVHKQEVYPRGSQVSTQYNMMCVT